MWKPIWWNLYVFIIVYVLPLRNKIWKGTIIGCQLQWFNFNMTFRNYHKGSENSQLIEKNKWKLRKYYNAFLTSTSNRIQFWVEYSWFELRFFFCPDQMPCQVWRAHSAQLFIHNWRAGRDRSMSFPKVWHFSNFPQNQNWHEVIL